MWALDWCPQSDLKPDSSVKCEVQAFYLRLQHHFCFPFNVVKRYSEVWSSNKSYRGKKYMMSHISRFVNLVPMINSYHKMGSPLTGRGLVQIWCVLNSSKSNEEALPFSGKSKNAHKNKGATKDNSTQIKRPRGRPKKSQLK